MFSWNEKGGTNNWGLLVSGPPQASVPQVVGVATAFSGTGQSSITIPVPSERQPGDLLLVVCGKDGNSNSSNWTAGWTAFGDLEDAGFEVSLNSAWKISDGTEVNVNFTSSNTSQWGGGCIAIRNYDLAEATPIERSVKSDSGGGASNPMDPPSFSPSWGTDNYLWIAAGAHDSGNMTNIDPPSGYTRAFWIDGGGLFGAGSIIAYKGEFNGTTEDPGGMTMSFSTEWVAVTHAVKGRPGASVNSDLLINENAVITDPRVDQANVMITEDGQYIFTE